MTTGTEFRRFELDADLGPLQSLTTIAAEEFADWTLDGTIAAGPGPSRPTSPFADEREYRYCKAVIDRPLRPSSAYPKLAGISPKTAQPIRQKLIEAGLIRQHQQDSGKRGGRTLLLEPMSPALEAVAKHNMEGHDACR